MGIVLWDGRDRWLFPLTPVGNKKELGRQIAGMNPGDMPSFQNVMDMAHAGLKASNANLKHMVVFSDGDPAAPSDPSENKGKARPHGRRNLDESKLPRVPVSENITGDEMPMFRNLWENIRDKMPKKGRGKSKELDPLAKA